MIRQLELNDSILIILHCWKIPKIDSVKLSSLNHCAQLAFIDSDFLTKKWWLLFKAQNKFPDGTSLTPGWIVPLPGFNAMESRVVAIFIVIMNYFQGIWRIFHVLWAISFILRSLWFKKKKTELVHIRSLWVSRVLKYPKKCLEDLAMFFMSTWWGDSKNMQEIEFSRWLFELPAK